jgi:hypothetical protein
MTPPSSFGADRVEPGPGESRVLLCPVAKGWIPREPATQTSAEHPGTAVRWDQEIFEVVTASPTEDGGARYRLEPWDRRHVIRVMEAYDAPAEEARGAEQEFRRDAIRRRRLSLLLSPILGHLPGAVQERMEWDFGAPARLMTIVSALPLFVVGSIGILARQMESFGGLLSASASVSFPAWLAPPLPLALYLFIESGLRLVVAFLQGQPMGSVLGVLLYELWRQTTRSGQVVTARAALSSRTKWEAADIYKMLEPLLAFLSEDEQELLERRFGFAVLRWGRRSAFLIGVVAILNVIISLGQLAQGRSTFWDFLWLLAGGYLCIEQVLRLREISRGHPAGSVLGGLVRPMARRLLAPPPA